MAEGFIKLHRKMKDWTWFHDVNTFCLFVHLILEASRFPRTVQGEDVPAGSYISSIRKLSELTGLSVAETRTALKHLISTHEITQIKKPKFTIYKVENYHLYQCLDTDNDIPLTQLSHTFDTPLTQEQERQERQEGYVSNVNPGTTQEHRSFSGGVRKPTMDEFKAFVFENNLHLNAVQIYKQLDSQGWTFNGTPIKSWQGLLISWNKRQLRENTPAPAQVSGYSNNNKIDTGLPDWYHKTEKKPASDELYAQAISLQAELRNNKESS